MIKTKNKAKTTEKHFGVNYPAIIAKPLFILYTNLSFHLKSSLFIVSLPRAKKTIRAQNCRDGKKKKM